ncbi:hypothetical protein [Burkholderia cenocepacia]|uniref:hypothetical protein n=1 Tax=Burkholderia cenocepacia TaxID=95486 RepID=UPI002AB080CE|nr:hypothetical protein [Burkholderia cenocepacia]
MVFPRMPGIRPGMCVSLIFIFQSETIRRLILPDLFSGGVAILSIGAFRIRNATRMLSSGFHPAFDGIAIPGNDTRERSIGCHTSMS